MRLLSASPTYLIPLTADVRTALPLVADLLATRDTDQIRFYCDGINEEMNESPLSAWFSLFVRFIFLCAYEEDKGQYRTLQAAVRGLHPPSKTNPADLSGFYEQAVAEGGEVFLKLNRLKQERKTLMSASYCDLNGKNRLDRDSELTAEITSLEAQTKPILALFLMVEKIIVILEERKVLQAAKESLTKKDILGDPVRFIADLIPILRLLQKREEKNLMPVIELTLQRVGIKDSRLASQIQETLLERKWLELVAPQEAKKAPQPPKGGLLRLVSLFKRSSSHAPQRAAAAAPAHPGDALASLPTASADAPLTQSLSRPRRTSRLSESVGKVIPATIDEAEEGSLTLST